MLEKHALRILILPYIPVETFKVVETYGSAFAIQYIENRIRESIMSDT